jgi:hypothetical protein
LGWRFSLESARIFGVTEQSIENRIQKIKQQIAELGDIRPGALSQQYNVCGNPTCRCKATPPVKHGPYYQISFTWKGKSRSQFVRDDDADEASRQLENYHQLRQLVDEWITLAVELSQLRMLERRAAEKKKSAAKRSIPNKKPN